MPASSTILSSTKTSPAHKRPRAVLALLALTLLAVVALLLLASLWNERNVSAASIEVSRTELISRGGLLYLNGAAEPFTGVMIETYESGALQSRSEVADGLLHGKSEGWYPDGQRQSREFFKNGVSHGVRTEWYGTGARMSESSIIQGKHHGLFKRWHTNGLLAEVIEMKNGVPDGAAASYYPSGFLKTRAIMAQGEPQSRETWPDNTKRAAPSPSTQ